MRLICFFLIFANLAYWLWYELVPVVAVITVQPEGVRALPEAVAAVPTLAGGVSEHRSLVLVAETQQPSEKNPAREAQVHSSTAALQDEVVYAHSGTSSHSKNIADSNFVSTDTDSDEGNQGGDYQNFRDTNNAVLGHEDPLVCWVTGPVFEPSAADNLVQRVQALIGAAQLTTMNIKIGEEYWVYVPPLASRKEALRRLRELQMQKVDSFIVTQGDYDNAISLGLFSRLASAENFQATLAHRGIQALVLTRDRTRREFWVQFQSQPSALDSALKRKLQGELNPLSWKSNSCSGALAADL